MGILQRLGFVQPRKMLGDQLGWPEAWIPEPGRRLFFIIDLRERRRPCAVFLICDPGQQAHQLFALNESEAALGAKNTALFAHTRGAKAPLSPTQRASSSVRRDLSHPSAQIAEFALRKICVAQDLHSAESA